MEKKIVIFDLDGTLCDNSHRDHLAREKNWDAFNAACYLDTIHTHIEAILRGLRPTHIIVLLTGRDERYMAMTRQWLNDHDVPYDFLFMRPHGSWSIADHDYKWMVVSKHFDPAQIDMVFEDRQRVVDMWRAHGIRCLQVAPGDF